MFAVVNSHCIVLKTANLETKVIISSDVQMIVNQIKKKFK